MISLGNVNTIASNSLLEFYLRNDDPRVNEVYTVNNEGIYVGLDQGEGLSPDFSAVQASDFSRPDIEPTHPVFFLTIPESEFLQAEALLRYGGGAGAEEKYNAGVAASFQLYSQIGDDQDLIGEVDTEDFTGDGQAYDYNGGASFEENLEQIIIQKWAALANINNIEAWIETKRTGYPVLTDPEDPLYEEGRRIISLASILPGDQIPFSLFYPELEVQRNTNIDQKNDLTERVWWNQ